MARGEYSVLSVMAEDRKTRLWIMLDPQSPPFYKQIPANLNFSLTDNEFDSILRSGNPISTVQQALESHLGDPTRAEQAESLKP